LTSSSVVYFLKQMARLSYLLNHSPITNLVCIKCGYGKYTIIIIIITNSVSIISTKYIFLPYWLKRYEIIQSLKEVCSTRKQCKMSSSKKIDLSRDFAAGVYLSEAQNPIPTPLPLTHCLRVYRILIHKGKWVRGREG
jgi:hypothetical protein